MSKEISHQYEMFTGELVDTRSGKQKKKDKHPLKQMDMFAPRQILQFGVKANPRLPLVSAKGTPIGMKLEIQDPRTEEDKEHDRMKAAEAVTYSFLEAQQPVSESQEMRTKLFPSGERLLLVEIMLDVAEADTDNEELAEEILIQAVEPYSALAVQLAEGVSLPYWATREVAYDWVQASAWGKGYRSYLVGEEHLEVVANDGRGSWRVTYAGDMIEDVQWLPTVSGP